MIIKDIIEYNGHYIASEFTNDHHCLSVLLVYTKNKPSTIVYEYTGNHGGELGMMLYGSHLVQTNKAKLYIDNLIKGHGL